MYSKEHIIATCKECGINSIASDLLMQALIGDLSGIKQIMPVVLDVITRDGIEFYKFEETPYYVSKCGTIYSSKRRRILKPALHGGYFVFTNSAGVYHGGFTKARRRKVHRVVAQQFVPNPENKPHVNHIDSNKLNNDYSNLEWVTSAENAKHYNQYSTKTTGKSNTTAKLTEEHAIAIMDLREKGVASKEIARIYGVCEASIWLIFKSKGIQHTPFK